MSAASWAQVKTFIVRSKPNVPGLGAYRALSAGPGFDRISAQMDRQQAAHEVRRLGAAAVNLPRSGALLVQTYSDLDRQAVQEHLSEQEHLVVEEDKFFSIYGMTNTPAHQNQSPWLVNMQGFGAAVDVDSATDTTSAHSASDVIVAVIDTGLDYNHPYLVHALAYNTGECSANPTSLASCSTNGADNDGNGYIDDFVGANVLTGTGDVQDTGTDHGTHVAGLVKVVRDRAIAEGESVAAKVKLMGVRFIGSNGVGSTSGALLSLEYAAMRGARVVNASWGARGSEAFSQAMFDSFADLYFNHDIVFSVAAGNADASGPNNNDLIPYFPASFSIPSQLTVASVTPFYVAGPSYAGTEFSSFSNFGVSSVQIAAPGDYRAAGESVLSATGVWSAKANDSGYVRKKGTSMATPYLAGVAGVVRAINPTLTAYEVSQLILNTATKHSYLTSRVSSGALINPLAAIAAAKTAVTQNLRPAVPTQSFESDDNEAAKDPAPTKKKGGGCGMITGPGDGPLGGNSLPLLALAYGLTLLARRAMLMYKQRHGKQA